MVCNSAGIAPIAPWIFENVLYKTIKLFKI